MLGQLSERSGPSTARRKDQELVSLWRRLGVQPRSYPERPDIHPAPGIRAVWIGGWWVLYDLNLASDGSVGEVVVRRIVPRGGCLTKSED